MLFFNKHKANTHNAKQIDINNRRKLEEQKRISEEFKRNHPQRLDKEEMCQVAAMIATEADPDEVDLIANAKTELPPSNIAMKSEDIEKIMMKNIIFYYMAVLMIS